LGGGCPRRASSEEQRVASSESASTPSLSAGLRADSIVLSVWWRHRTGAESIRRVLVRSAADGDEWSGSGGVSPMPAGPPCPARSRSSDPPLAVYRFGDPRVLGVRIVQMARDTGGNVGDAIRRFADVRAYAHVETDTSLTLSLYARARAWEDGVGEGHFVGARSRSEDRGVQRSRASRT
jgi:hypothetical protein